MSDGAQDRLVWIDCEMTGLDLSNDLLVEVAVVVTDSELTLLDDGLDIVIGATQEQLERMPDVVRDMHGSSGLTDAVLASTTTLHEAEQQVLEYVKRFVPEAKKAPLCGNSIATDRGFIARDMPALDAWLHYRMVDVSSVKELARRWYPRAYYNAPAKGGGHRGLADIKESVTELAYYRSVLFVPQPGPTSDQAAAAAAALVADPAGASRTPMPSEQVPD